MHHICSTDVQNLPHRASSTSQGKQTCNIEVCGKTVEGKEKYLFCAFSNVSSIAHRYGSDYPDEIKKPNIQIHLL
jgi:hypothetical protein